MKPNECMDIVLANLTEHNPGRIYTREILADAPRLAEENERLKAVNAELVEACKLAKSLLEGLNRTNGNVYQDIYEALSRTGGE